MSIQMKKVYFDNAATTPMREDVINYMVELMQDNFGNPSSTHAVGRKAKAMMELSRKKIAKHLGVKSSEIIFTSGGTEADNIIILGAVKDLDVKRIITSKIEHHAVINSSEFISEKNGVKLDYVNLTKEGLIDYTHLEQLLAESDEKTLVSLMHINNELGHITDIKHVGELCQKYKALFHSDTVQSLGFYPVDFTDVAVDFITASAHKFYGPKGIGFAVIKNQPKIKPLIYGGSQERGRRAGTENTFGVGGMEKALTLAYENMDKEHAHVKMLKTYCIDLLKETFPKVRINGLSGDFEKSSHKVVNFTLPHPNFQSDMLILQLDMRGISCSKGSACQSGSQIGSFVLNEIYGENQHGLRVSFSINNTKEEVAYFVKTLKEILD